MGSSDGQGSSPAAEQSILCLRPRSPWQAREPATPPGMAELQMGVYWVAVKKFKLNDPDMDI